MKALSPYLEAVKQRKAMRIFRVLLKSVPTERQTDSLVQWMNSLTYALSKVNQNQSIGTVQFVEDERFADTMILNHEFDRRVAEAIKRGKS